MWAELISSYPRRVLLTSSPEKLLCFPYQSGRIARLVSCSRSSLIASLTKTVSSSTEVSRHSSSWSFWFTRPARIYFFLTMFIKNLAPNPRLLRCGWFRRPLCKYTLRCHPWIVITSMAKHVIAFRSGHAHYGLIHAVRAFMPVTETTTTVEMIAV